jgi:8-oxo-dGTP diphosphatase
MWAPPGGHLEEDESVEQCAARELLEETGIVARAWHVGPYSVNDFADISRRYVTLFVVSTASDGDAQVREPDKCAQWQWYAWDALPSPLFAPFAAVVARGWSPFTESP